MNYKFDCLNGNYDAFNENHDYDDKTNPAWCDA